MIPFSAEDLNRILDAKAVTRGRTLLLFGAVDVTLTNDAVKGTVEDKGTRRKVTVTTAAMGERLTFGNHCNCGQSGCAHIAATALAALDKYPQLRRSAQNSFLGQLDTGPAPETLRLQVRLEPGKAPDVACFVSFVRIGERTQRLQPITAERVAADHADDEDAVELANVLGAVPESRIAVPVEQLAGVIDAVLHVDNAIWSRTAKPLKRGEERIFPAGAPPPLPPRSSVLIGDTGHWYVDGATGAVGRMRLKQPETKRGAAPKPARIGRLRGERTIEQTASERAIVNHAVIPVLRMQRLRAPDDFGRLVMMDVLMLDFDYGGTLTGGEDERQFVRTASGAFVKRDPDAEAAAAETLRQENFTQMRVADGRSARGRFAYVFRGPGAAEDWHRFLSDRAPALETRGFRSQIESGFGPKVAQKVGDWDLKISDRAASAAAAVPGTAPGEFELDFGIEIDGERIPLLPILANIIARGGLETAQITGESLVTTLEDGRVVKLPADKIRRMLAIMGDLIEAAETRQDTIVLPQTEAPTVIELEQLLLLRWQDAGRIQQFAERYRSEPKIPDVVIPSEFRGELRHYQQDGVAWMQHLMASRLGALLADDMGLGKTAQTIAHITIEHASGRMKTPVLIVVPTSLIPNWTSELEKFAPGLRVAVLHGLDRHKKRERLRKFDVVITTYTVLTRDILEMKLTDWHIIVLDEAQAIKSPDAKATKAVCELDARQRVCLSGTPIENNLEELWSQFAFLMPGLLGERRIFAKRFRTPIEKNGDPQRRQQLARRIKPFILRRTKSEVATELPPKHTILRRISLAPEQRELYEAIRISMYERVRDQIAERSLAQSRIVVLDALLKLRQACCDPRLVKLRSAQNISTSSKLDELLEMINEMIPEGRRILLFSQFTSMLDLIKPRLVEANVAFVELRGDTLDRAEPVRSFEAGEVPLFLISLKAGGRGLNLISADTVIHYDPWWNPAVEDQASDRAHRIGQTKSVFVYKMIAADTVEERILDLQARKAELAALAFSDSEDATPHPELGTLDTNDIDFLFGETPSKEKRAA